MNSSQNDVLYDGHGVDDSSKIWSKLTQKKSLGYLRTLIFKVIRNQNNTTCTNLEPNTCLGRVSCIPKRKLFFEMQKICEQDVVNKDQEKQIVRDSESLESLTTKIAAHEELHCNLRDEYDVLRKKYDE